MVSCIKRHPEWYDKCAPNVRLRAASKINGPWLYGPSTMIWFSSCLEETVNALLAVWIPFLARKEGEGKDQA